jgi:hypothetical protein
MRCSISEPFKNLGRYVKALLYRSLRSIVILLIVWLLCPQKPLVGEPFYLAEFFHPYLVGKVFGEGDVEIKAHQRVGFPYLVGKRREFAAVNLRIAA